MRSIKTKLFSLAMAVSMVLALAGCAMSAPSTVGSIGGVEIPAGIYLLAQYSTKRQSTADFFHIGPKSSHRFVFSMNFQCAI